MRPLQMETPRGGHPKASGETKLGNFKRKFSEIYETLQVAMVAVVLSGEALLFALVILLAIGGAV